MINLSKELKDSFKLGETERKILSLDFYPININVTNTNIVSESLKLVEKINSEENLVFGSCIASEVSFTVFGVSEELKGSEVNLTLNVSETDIPLGHFIVDSANKQDDKRFKDVVAYDRMRLVDTDVSEWYKGLFPTGSETYTLSQFRASLLSYVGIEEDDLTTPLPNDGMTVEHTISPSQISGRVVIEACEELNGCFGHMNRDGKFTHVILSTMHDDYPQDDYPQEDYPLPEPYDEVIGLSQKVKYEEYSVKPIDRIQIRKEENDIGAIYGDGTNTYIIQDNFLVYGKSAEDLQIIAQNASINIFGRGYRPFSADVPGLPYIEVGDYLKYDKEDSVSGHLFERTLKGIQSLKDTLVAKGEEEQTQGSDKNNEILELKGKAAIFEKSVDEVKTTLYDLEQRAETIIDQTAEMVSIEATRAIGAEGELRGSITATSEQINLEVSRVTAAENELSSGIDLLAGKAVIKARSDGKYASVELDADPETGSSIKWKADSLEIDGIVTANGNFRILLDGSMEALNATISGNIIGSLIQGSRIEVEGSGVIQSTNWDGTSYGVDFDELILSAGKLVSRKTRYFNGGSSSSMQGEISGGVANMCKVMCQILGDDQNYIGHGYIANLHVSNGMDTPNINGYTPLTAGNIGSYTGDVQCNNIICSFLNGYSPITSGNISQQYVYYAQNALTAGSASQASYATSAGSISGTLYSNSIYGTNSGGAINFSNVAAVGWEYAHRTFAAASDINLKFDIQSMDIEKAMSFYLNLKPKSFRYKDGFDGFKVNTGLVAQQVLSNLEHSNISESGLVYEADNVLDQGLFTKGKHLELRYNDLHAYHILMIQELYKQVQQLKGNEEHERN